MDNNNVLNSNLYACVGKFRYQNSLFISIDLGPTNIQLMWDEKKEGKKKRISNLNNDNIDMETITHICSVSVSDPFTFLILIEIKKKEVTIIQ